MGSYVQNNLVKGETVQYEAQTSVWSLLPLIFFGLLLFPLGIILLAMAAIRYFSTELVITNKRVIAKFGLIQRKTIELNIPKVESVMVDQGVLGRLCNYGSIVVSGAGNPQAKIPGISKPIDFRNKFFEIQEA